MPTELWIILKVFKNKLLALTVKERNRYVDQCQQETTIKMNHCKGVLWSTENGKTTFINTTSMILALALSKDYHINVSYEDNSCSLHDHKLQLCNEVSKLNLPTLTLTILHGILTATSVTKPNNYGMSCLLLLYTHIQQNSINLTCTEQERCPIIEYSWLLDSTYTGLSPER